jgi:hypothetical protein
MYGIRLVSVTIFRCLALPTGHAKGLFALEDVCPIKYLVGQAGGLRGRKTFLGFSAGRDFAANLD